VTLTGTGFPPGQYEQLWCTPDFVPDEPGTVAGACQGQPAFGPISVGDDGSFSRVFGVYREAGDWFAPIVCGDGPDACHVAISTGAADAPGATVLASMPLAQVPETLTVTPTTGVLDGQALTVEGTGLYPGSASIVSLCPDGTSGNAYDQLGRCNVFHDGVLVSLVADADGRGTVTVPAAVMIGNGSQVGQTICTDQCHVRALVGTASRFREVPISFAEAELAVTPAAGLVDGQTVQVDATDLALSYDGRPVWIFPSGGWSLTQCDAAVGDAPTLAGLFDGCAAAPTTRAVTVDDNQLHGPLEVRSTFTSFLGREVDCAAAPGACAVGLVRLEENGVVSAHLTPVAFGP
jgi:hypothetical protein